jgi:hypothetical protein
MSVFKDIVQPKKRGVREGSRGVHTDSPGLRAPSPMFFLGILNVLLLCFKFQKNDFSVYGLKKVDIALQPM